MVLKTLNAMGPQHGLFENNRHAKFYRITKAGQKQFASEVTQWAQALKS
jgi:hypothetical protein